MLFTARKRRFLSFLASADLLSATLSTEPKKPVEQKVGHGVGGLTIKIHVRSAL